MEHLTIKTNSREEGNFFFTRDTSLVKVWGPELNVRPRDEFDKFVKDIDTKEIISDQKKFLIEIHGSPYHHVVHTYGTILNALAISKDPLFIFNITNLKPEACDINLIEFFYCFLKENKINHIFLDSSRHENVLINNFYYSDSINTQPIPNPISTIGECFSQYVKDLNVLPNKKVYLSRKSVKTKTFEFEGYEKDFIDKKISRVYDEEALEIYFKTKGFEIIYPENFLSFEDQINFFYQVKTLVSLSGGGSLNCIFMQPNTNVVELVTYLTTPAGQPYRDGKFIDSHHQFFADACNEKDIFYHSVKNSTKLSADIIKKIELNKYLLGMINE